MSTVGPPVLVVSEVSKRYGRSTVLDRVCLTVAQAEIVALTGENGAGKSTLMRICAGLERADAGTVTTLDGVGYCPQDESLFELLTADEHLMMFGRAASMTRREALRRGHRLLAEFDYSAGRDVSTCNLSGGTRQKLNLALAVLADPPLLLLDEPYQGFDRGTYVNFWDHCRTWQQQGTSIVVVTHMLAELGRADRVVELPAHATRPARHP